MSGGTSDTDVKALAVSPAGRPSPSRVVTTVTPLAKLPRPRRKSSGETTLVLVPSPSRFFKFFARLDDSVGLTPPRAGPYTSDRVTGGSGQSLPVRRSGLTNPTGGVTEATVL